ncbi:MAG: D-inositol-3-phosphate glycosyltransferase [Actinomycetales bacterium]|nr:D-inositol-3-phosphate glycosyltransferase [Actinomycetales bacterium]
MAILPLEPSSRRVRRPRVLPRPGRPDAGPRRVAVLSIHTSPLDQPGTGDAGGMNVYVTEVARRLAARGVEVDIFTRATSGDLPPSVAMEPGVTVRHVTAGPFQGLSKEDLPGQLCAVTSGILRAEAARPEGWYDLVQSHYWLSGQVGWLAAERWNVPLVHTMHTMAKVKNLTLADGDVPEPEGRVIGEQQVVDAADRILANTAAEAEQLVDLYDADPEHVAVVHPGVDLDVFSPGDRARARARVGVAADRTVLLFVGRIQPLKAPDVLVRAAAAMVARMPSLRDTLEVVICGGPSGSGLAHPHALEDLAVELGVHDLVRFVPPVGRAMLADWYRAADVCVVPSYSESFGLVAVEAQACGTPVVAARVGGLPTAVADGVSGLLVDGHDPAVWAETLCSVVGDPGRLARWSRAAVLHASRFGWDATAAATLEVYRDALAGRSAAGRLAVAQTSHP